MNSRSTHSLDGLQQQLWSFAGQRVLTVASRVGLLARLAQQPTTTSAAASDLGLDPLATAKMTRALCALGWVEPVEGGYRVRQEFACLFRDGEDDLRPFLEHSHALYDRWGESLEGWVRGQPWQTRRRGADETAKFARAMQAMGTWVAAELAQAIDLSGARCLLDVGGGVGTYARRLCRSNPALQAVVLDVPDVVELGRADIAQSELAGRVQFVGGDYLVTAWGTDYDVVLLANVLHQESRARASELVGRAARALVPGGRVIVVDFAIDEAQHKHLMGALFSINMRSFGDTHTEGTVRGWFAEHGLVGFERRDLGETRWALVARRPET